MQGAGCKVEGSGFRVQGAGFRVQGSGFGVWDVRLVAIEALIDAVLVVPIPGSGFSV